MKTGIIRRVDDWGRIVIPREIRKQMGIIEGDPLEVCPDFNNHSIVFQKYQYTPLDDILHLIGTLSEEDQEKLTQYFKKR